MSLQATLYKIEDDPQTLLKNIETVSHTDPISISPTSVVDIINPTFILNYDEDYTGYNYIYVGAPFNRYYFIEDFKIDIGKKIEISCSIDVLQTYWLSLMECEAQIIRTGRWADNARYLADNVYPVSSWTQTQNYEFSENPFTTIDSLDGRYILTVIGGTVSQLPPEPEPEEEGGE